jgi:hypothetical protein
MVCGMVPGTVCGIVPGTGSGTGARHWLLVQAQEWVLAQDPEWTLAPCLDLGSMGSTAQVTRGQVYKSYDCPKHVTLST